LDLQRVRGIEGCEMKIRAFITHKEAEHFSDCQDRFSINTDTKSIALADGMSQSYQQKIWAELLVEEYTRNTEWVPNHFSVKELALRWKEQVDQFVQQMKASGGPEYLIVMNENAIALKKSAGATFCGVRFNGNNWDACILGDSCMIEVENYKIIDMYTSQQSESFDNHPDYFDSNPSKDGKGEPIKRTGELSKNKPVIMVSDPLADFLNKKRKSNEGETTYLEQLLSVKSHNDFEDLVARWRGDNMHNDDTTLMIIEDDGRVDFRMEHVDDIDKLIKEEKEKQFAGKDILRNECVSQAKKNSAEEKGVSEEEFLREGEKIVNRLYNLGLKKSKLEYKKPLRQLLRGLYKLFNISRK